MLGRWFPGFIVAVWHQGTLHRFATYTGAVTETLDITDDHVAWSIRDRRKRLEIYASCADTSILPGPNRVDMEKRVPETLKATIQVCMTELSDGKPIIDATGDCAGLEVAGDVERMLRAINQPSKNMLLRSS
jgi:hypothetical protein